VGVKSIKTFAERMRNESVNRAIMVVIGSLTPFSRQCLAEMAPKYYIEVVRAPRRRTACWRRSGAAGARPPDSVRAVGGGVGV